MAWIKRKSIGVIIGKVNKEAVMHYISKKFTREDTDLPSNPTLTFWENISNDFNNMSVVVDVPENATYIIEKIVLIQTSVSIS